MMQAPKTWVIVADNNQAKIYEIEKLPHLKEIHYFIHPESRLHNQDLSSTRPGYNAQSGGVRGHSYQQQTDPKDVEIEKFASSLAQILEKHFEKNDFEAIYLLCDPSFLGVLRKKLSVNLTSSIKHEIAKNVVTLDTKSLGEYIVNYLNK